MSRFVSHIGAIAHSRFSWTLAASLVLAPLVSGPVIGQEEAAEADGSKPELLWHQSSALFPIRVFLPEDFDAERTFPAVIALHGFSGSSERFGRVGRAFAEAGFIVAVPEGPYPVPTADPGRHSTWELSTWTEEYGLGPPLTDDLAIETRSAGLTVSTFLPSVIERIREQYRVGPMYVFGFSLGGVYALVTGVHNHDRLDGIIAFGATYYPELFTAQGGRLEDGNDLQVRLALGRSDPSVPLSNAVEARDAFREAGYEVVLDEFDGGHTVPDEALKRAVEWLRLVASRQ